MLVAVVDYLTVLKRVDSVVDAVVDDDVVVVVVAVAAMMSLLQHLVY